MGIPNFPSSSAPSSSRLDPINPLRSYRNVQPLPTRLLDHCTVCIEEQLFSQAIPLLSSALTAGHGTPKPAFVPPTQHLSLLATLIIHPFMTTRTASKEKQTASDDALRYLRQLNNFTSANSSGLTKALQFTDAASSRSKRARTRFSDTNNNNSDDDDFDGNPGYIRSTYAKKESLFTTAEDFWAVVGWAFNCSVVHEQRWERYKIWLDLMLDILQDDLESSFQKYRESSPRDESIMKSCLISQYLAPFIDQGRNTKRRIMRAILADGTKTSLNQHPEIWRNETLPPKTKSPPKTGLKRPLDVDQGEFGDYFDSESDSETSPPDSTTTRPSRQPSTRHPSTNATNSPNTTPQPPNTTTTTHGPSTSLHLRLRLLTLLTRVSTLHPPSFLDTEDLFDLYTEFLRPLPLPVFSYFILTPTIPSETRREKASLDPHALSSLIQMLLRPLLSSSAPSYNANVLTPEVFAKYYAPFAANVGAVGENARVGVCVEGLARLLFVEGGFAECGGEVMGSVREAVEVGVSAREERAGADGRRRGGREGDGGRDWEVLVEGGGRLRGLVGLV